MFYRRNIEKKIIEIGKQCDKKGYTPGYSGNISARYKEGMLITTSGSSNGLLSKKEIVYTNFEGNVLEKNKKASSEKFLHIELYKKRPDINYVLHVHSPYLTSFASAGLDLMEPIMAENIFYFGGIPLAKYALPSSKELVDNTITFFDKYDVVLMENHGVVIVSETLEDAFAKLDLAETYAQVVLNTKLLGGARMLSEEEAQAVFNLR